MTRVIAFIGLNGSGKSTAADIAAQYINKQGFSVEVKPLARPLKLLANKFFGIDKRENRFALEELAEQLKFLFGTDIFTKNVISNSNDLEFLIIPDMRFIEEYNTLKAWCDEIFVIEIKRTVETSIDDISRMDALKKNNLQISGIIDAERTALVTQIHGLVSKIVEEKT